MNEASSFRQLTTTKERESVLSRLADNSLIISGAQVSPRDGQNHFLFTAVSFDKNRLQVKALGATQLHLRSGDEVELMFGGDDGQYVVQTQVEDTTPLGDVILTVGQSIYRIERRSSMRMGVPNDEPVFFDILSIKTHALKLKKPLRVINLGLGGMRITWPSELEAPAIGSQVSGQIVLPTKKKFEIFAIVRNAFPDPTGFELGVEFQNLSVKDEQALVYVCFQFQKRQGLS